MIDETKVYFNNLSSSWDTHYARSSLFKARYLEFERLIKRYSNLSWSTLDYGCGSGILTQLLLGSFGQVVATDISEKMLDITSRRFSGNNRVEVVPIANLGSSKFDLILCSSVIEYVDNPSELIAELAFLLKPDGVLLITFANRYGILQLLNRCLLSHLKHDPYTIFQKHVFTSSIIKEMLQITGLKIENLRSAIGLPLLRSIGFGELLFVVASQQGVANRHCFL